MAPNESKIFHRAMDFPEIAGGLGFPFQNATFWGPRSCDVAIIWPECIYTPEKTNELTRLENWKFQPWMSQWWWRRSISYEKLGGGIFQPVMLSLLWMCTLGWMRVTLHSPHLTYVRRKGAWAVRRKLGVFGHAIIPADFFPHSTR